MSLLSIFKCFNQMSYKRITTSNLLRIYNIADNVVLHF